MNAARLAGKCARAVVAAGVLATLAGCGLPTIEPAKVDAVRHFTLSAPATAAVAPGGLRLKPVELAGHLRGRELAVRVGANEVIYLENARWAEPLDQGIAGLLRARLAGVDVAGTVAVQVARCELVRTEGNTVQFSASWTLAFDDPQKPVQRGVFNAAPRTWDGRDPGALVALLRAAVEELGGTVAQAATPGGA